MNNQEKERRDTEREGIKQKGIEREDHTRNIQGKKEIQKHGKQ
jgi:hypothetical protein